MPNSIDMMMIVQVQQLFGMNSTAASATPFGHVHVHEDELSGRSEDGMTALSRNY